MPFQRPTLPTIIQQTQANIASRLSGSNPLLPFSTLQILGYVFAGNQYALYSYLDWISKQAIPVTASDESLMAWAALKGLTLIPAASATGQVQFTGVPSTSIPDGTVLVRGDGVTYEIPAGSGGTITANSIFDVTVVATTPGQTSNLTIGGAFSSFFIQVPIAGVNNTVTMISDFTGGTDVETQESLRVRMIESFSNPVQGGDLQDYVTWSLQFPGVTRAWSAGPERMGAGTVSVYFMMDDTESAFFGIPQGSNGGSASESRIVVASGDQLALANHLYTLRAATALVWCLAPSPVALNISLVGVPNDTVVRQGIFDAVVAFCRREATPGGVKLNDPTKPSGIVRISHLEAAISAVPGLDFFDMVTPSADILVDIGQILVPGLISYN